MLEAFRPTVRVLHRAVRGLERLVGGSLEPGFEAHPNGLVVRLQGHDIVRVLVQQRSASPAWATTASLALVLKEGGDEPEDEALLHALVTLLQRLDPGDLRLGCTLPSGVSHPGRGAEEHARRKALAERTRAALSEELAEAAFVAHQGVVHEDLYPHVGPLGEPVSAEQVQEGWRRSLERRARGEGAQKLGLYVHIPFCAVACSFCYCGKTDDFDRARFDAYHQALLNEVRDFGPLFEGHAFTSVYFGGGTPSLLPAPHMRRMFELLWSRLQVPQGTQIIYEGNPDSLSDAKIEVLARLGRVTRLTVGVQTLDDEVQARVRRFNKPHHVRDAVEAARRHGIPHVNLDLMAGLPGQTVQSFERDLRFLLSLSPDSVHMNAFRPLPRIRLESEGQRAGGPAWKEQRDRMMALGRELLREHGHAVAEDGRLRRTHDASNLQEYDLRTQNSSLLGLGFPALSHAFGSWFYCPDRSAGFDPALQRELAEGRRWVAVSADGPEEAHKYLVTNLVTGWSRGEFHELFGLGEEDVASEALQKLYDLDVLDVEQERVVTRSGGPADTFVHRTLLYSEALGERIDQVWGPQRQAGVDYRARLARLLEAS